jgi:hypothetical protein
MTLIYKCCRCNSELETKSTSQFSKIIAVHEEICRHRHNQDYELDQHKRVDLKDSRG